MASINGCRWLDINSRMLTRTGEANSDKRQKNDFGGWRKYWQEFKSEKKKLSYRDWYDRLLIP